MNLAMPSQSLLPAEPAIPFYPKLAAMIGVPEALILAQIRFMWGIEGFGQTRKGRKWVNFTYSQIQRLYLPCFSISTIRRAVESLVTQSLLLKDQSWREDGSNGGLWFAFHEDAWVLFTEERFAELHTKRRPKKLKNGTHPPVQIEHHPPVQIERAVLR